MQEKTYLYSCHRQHYRAANPDRRQYCWQHRWPRVAGSGPLRRHRPTTADGVEVAGDFGGQDRVADGGVGGVELQHQRPQDSAWGHTSSLKYKKLIKTNKKKYHAFQSLLVTHP